MSVPALVLGVVSYLAAQQEPSRPAFRVSAHAVQVDVFAARGGKAVLGLGLDAFELYDDGTKQSIRLVDIDTVPLNVAMVLDASRSVAGDKLRNLQGGVHALIDGLETGDRAALITFAQHLSLRAELTSDRAELHRAVDSVSASGATAWHDGLYAGLKMLEDAAPGRLLIIFTDADDTYSWLEAEQLLPVVEQSDAVVYAVTPTEKSQGPGTAFSAERRQWRTARERREARTRLLRELTEASGGRLIETPSIDRLQAIFVEILAEMKTRYLLSFQPSAPIREGWHDIEVESKVRGLEIRARRGYFYEPQR